MPDPVMNPQASAPGAFARVVYPSVTRPGADAAAREADGARAEARGHAAGYAAGLRAAELELAARRAVLEAEQSDLLDRIQSATVAALSTLAAAARALDARVVESVSDAEEALVASAFDLAEAVVGYELRASEPVVDEASARTAAGAPTGAGEPARADDPREGRTARAAVARALAAPGAAAVTTVRLHPLDLAQLDESTRASTAPGVVFAADPTLGRGDAEADLPAGLIDARLGSALDRARRALLEAPPAAPAQGGVA